MKIFKTLLYTAAVSAVMVYGCARLYDENAANSNVFAETETPADEPAENATAEAEVLTVPVSDKEISLTSGTSVSFTFLGDCLLASNAGDTRADSLEEYAKVQPPVYFFEKALPYYSESDFVIANNEFVLSDKKLSKQSKSGDSFWFKAPSSRAQVLKSGGIDIVSIANNHTYDYGYEGYTDTIENLEAAGIKWGDLNNTVYVEKDGISFGIICTNLNTKNYSPTLTPVIEEVKEKSDIQILFFHGGSENEHIPEDWLVELCHEYADMGVDLIVGAHPHVLQPMENYNGTDIIYSIGNFCYGGNRLPENRTVILTETFYFDKSGKYISQEESFTPFYVYTGEHNNWQPAPVTDPVEISKTIAYMYGANERPVR